MRFGAKAVERGNACDDWRERGWYLRIGRVGPMLDAVDTVAMDAGVKGALKLADSAGKLYRGAAAGNFVDGESVAG